MSAASIVSSTLTSGFIDLATFDELEKYMYGGNSAITYFVRETRKSTWFTQVPTALSRSSGTADFNQEWSANISRSGDYLLQAWVRTTIPAVTLTAASNFTIRWTRNLMHNLIREASVTFNDLSAERIDNFFLDFWSSFTVPAGKRVGYDNMIGNISALIQPTAAGVATRSVTLNLPLPFFFTRDSGVALPTAALPYNDMKIQLWFRDWSELLVVDNLTAAAGANPSAAPTLAQLGGTAPSLSNTYVWANYAIVSNDERKRMGCAPRDILIEQVQTAPVQTWAPATNPNPSYDIRFSHAIKELFFAVWNTTTASDRSNYVNTSAVPSAGFVNFAPPFPSATDPILATSLLYENSARLQYMGSDYFSLVQPYYQPNAVIPVVSGYHMYSYSLDFLSCDPQGSTNYGKLTNISIVPYATTYAVSAAGGTLASPGGTWAQTYMFVVVGVNNNIIRVSGGALGRNFYQHHLNMSKMLSSRPTTSSCHQSCDKTLMGKQWNYHSSMTDITA